MRLHFSARERRDRLLRIASQPDSSWSGPLVAVSTMTPTASAAYDLGDPALWAAQPQSPECRTNGPFPPHCRGIRSRRV